MLISALFLIAAMSAHDNPGPDSPSGRTHGHEVVAGIFDEIESRAVSATAGSIWPYNDGPLPDLYADAMRNCTGRAGTPLIVELTVSEEPADGTIIYYNPLGAQAAATIAGSVTSVGWSVIALPDPGRADPANPGPNLVTDCAAVRVVIGSVAAPKGGRGSLATGGELLRNQAWRASFGSQLVLALMECITQRPQAKVDVRGDVDVLGRTG